ncbi:hypothetical protein HDU86_002646 [Geranomyces michiganensis]|nr:hypothetical protein HDU86_002646 [Geranomyces michiganensis]
MPLNVDHEIALLQREITRLGTHDPATNTTSVKFGVLVKDEQTANIFEALVQTLRAAKKRKVVAFEGEMLLEGPSNNVDVILLQPATPAGSEAK